MTATVYLIHSAASPERLKRACEGAGVSWLFFSQDYARMLEWERSLGADFERLDTRGGLVAAANALRQPFLDRITELGRRHDSRAWWASRVSERNTMVSPLYLNCCYLRVGTDRLAEANGSLAFVAESWSLLETLADFATGLSHSVSWVSRPSRMRIALHRGAVRAYRVSRFLRRAAAQAFAGPSPAPLPADRPTVLLHTFLDEQTLGADGQFRDRYLPGLRAWLESTGIAVAHLPVLFNMKRGYRATWQWLTKSRDRFVNPYRCYRLGDYLTVLGDARRGHAFDLRAVALGGLNTGGIFAEAQANHAYDDGTLEALLVYHLPRRLRERGLHFDLMIAEYENMVIDKLLVAGFRDAAPQTKLAGFQHGALYPMMLCNFVTAGEASFAPLPDRVVANGDFFRDILVAEGLPAERVVSGPALRYRHLWREAKPSATASGKDIFVPLPLVAGDALELLAKLTAAFGPESGITVALKPHPMTTAKVFGEMRAASLPPNFHIVSGDIGPWLASARVVIALSSSALFEALAAGVPVVPVGREAALDLNPLAWHEGFSRQYCSPADIHAETRRILGWSPDELAAYRRQTRQILAESFGQVDESTMRAFVDGLLPTARATPSHESNHVGHAIQ